MIVSGGMLAMFIVPHSVTRYFRPPESAEDKQRRELLSDVSVRYAVGMLDTYLEAEPSERVKAMLAYDGTVIEGTGAVRFKNGLERAGTIRALLRLRYPGVMPPEVRARFIRDGLPLTETEIISDFAALLTMNGLTLPL